MIIKKDVKCKIQSANFKMQSAKYKVQNMNSNYNCKYEYNAFLYLSPTFFISSFSFFLSIVSFSQLGIPERYLTMSK